MHCLYATCSPGMLGYVIQGRSQDSANGGAEVGAGDL